MNPGAAFFVFVSFAFVGDEAPIDSGASLWEAACSRGEEPNAGAALFHPLRARWVSGRACLDRGKIARVG